MVEVASRRGWLEAPAKIGGIEPGHVHSVPLRLLGRERRSWRAVNELTLTAWDPISNQPYYKCAAVQIGKAGERSLREKTADLLSKAKDRASEVADKMMASTHKERVRVPDYLGMLQEAHEQFAVAYESVSSRYFEEPEIRSSLGKLAKFSRESVDLLAPFIQKYGQHKIQGAGSAPQDFVLGHARQRVRSGARLTRPVPDGLRDPHLAHRRPPGGTGPADGELLKACGQIEEKIEFQRLCS